MPSFKKAEEITLVNSPENRNNLAAIFIRVMFKDSAITHQDSVATPRFAGEIDKLVGNLSNDNIKDAFEECFKIANGIRDTKQHIRPTRNPYPGEPIGENVRISEKILPDALEKCRALQRVTSNKLFGTTKRLDDVLSGKLIASLEDKFQIINPSPSPAVSSAARAAGSAEAAHQQ